MCERVMELESAGEGIPWEKVIKIAGCVGVWVIAYLLWRRR
jgi:hypothetical protein